MKLVTNGTLLTMNEEMTVIENGAVLIKDDRIAEVGRAEQFDGANPDHIIDAGGGIIMPGLVNAHTHAAMTLFRGLADDLPLMAWLQEHIFPAESRLTKEKVHAGAMLACAEMILSGTTCFCDMYLFEDEVARAAKASGMRAVVGEVLYDFPSPNYGEIENGFEYVTGMIEKWHGDPLITVAVEPHSTYICNPDLLKRAARIASENSIPLVVHVAETAAEHQQIEEAFGKSPVAHLADLGVLGPNLVACHSVHLSDSDIMRYREHGVKVAHCPESNMKLASGVAPVPSLIEKGVCVGIGTDGCASNNDLDLFQEMDTAAKLHKVFSRDPEVVNAETAVKMATVNGAEALGLKDATGSIEAGEKGGINLGGTSKPHMIPMYNPYSHLVYTASGGDVAAAVIDGKVVMENGTVFTMDVGSVMETVKRFAVTIKENDMKK